jgi:hypothetical protein
VLGLVSVQSGDQAERQYFHFAGSVALRRIARYGPKDPGLTPPGSQAETSFVFSHTHFQRTIQNGVACINDETNPFKAKLRKAARHLLSSVCGVREDPRKDLHMLFARRLESGRIADSGVSPT